MDGTYITATFRGGLGVEHLARGSSSQQRRYGWASDAEIQCSYYVLHSAKIAGLRESLNDLLKEE